MKLELDTLVLEAPRLNKIHQEMSKWTKLADNGKILIGMAD